MKYRAQMLDEDQTSRIAAFLEDVAKQYCWKGYAASLLFIDGHPNLLLSIRKGIGLAMPLNHVVVRICELLQAAQITSGMVLVRDPWSDGCFELHPDGSIGQYFDMVEPTQEHYAEVVTEQDDYPAILGGKHWDDLTSEQQEEIRRHNEAMGGGSN